MSGELALIGVVEKLQRNNPTLSLSYHRNRNFISVKINFFVMATSIEHYEILFCVLLLEVRKQTAIGANCNIGTEYNTEKRHYTLVYLGDAFPSMY